MTTKWLHQVAVLAGTVGALATASCDNPLVVKDPDIVEPGTLEGAAGLPALRGGALGDFIFAYSGGSAQDAVITMGALGDEFFNSETFPTRIEADRRLTAVQNGTYLATFRNIQRARLSTLNAAAAVRQFSTTAATDTRIAEMHTLAGFVYVFLGENYCNGVPLSRPNPDGTLDNSSYGDPQTNVQLYGLAVAQFDSALTHSGISAAVGNLARIGKGRAQVNLAQFAAAAVTVGAVPITFSYTVGHSINTPRQENGTHTLTQVTERWSVSDLEGGNGLNYRGAADPRVVAVRIPANNVGFDNQTAQWNLSNIHNARDAVAKLADGIEGKLIVAEAALQAGNFTAWRDTLNVARATVAGLLPLVDPGTQVAREDLMFRERAFWMFATGHRVGDLRRLIRQYGRGANTVFPTGTYHKAGTTYGNDVNFPVPFEELANPKYSGCLDRNP